jgi:hypothetical protein
MSNEVSIEQICELFLKMDRQIKAVANQNEVILDKLDKHDTV